MIILLMGVSGSGKTTIGKHLAATLNWEFYDGDDFHPAANIAKMSRGMPLEDRDREPWLQALRQAIALWLQEGKNVILACSALKSSYRQQLTQESSQVHLVYLRGDCGVNCHPAGGASGALYEIGITPQPVSGSGRTPGGGGGGCGPTPSGDR